MAACSLIGCVLWIGCSEDDGPRDPGGSAGAGATGAATAGSESGGTAAAAGGAAGASAVAGTSGAAGVGGSVTGNTWDWTGVVGTGQSLSVGASGTPLVATTQVHSNLKLALGALAVPPYDDASPELMMVPLVEPIRPLAAGYPSPYPSNLYGETPHTAMARQISALALSGLGRDYVTAHIVVGESGQPMTMLNKLAVDANGTGRAYAATLFEARATARLAAAAGKSYGIGGILITHGESDTGNANYASDLLQLWTDYNADLKAITGQTQGIPLFTNQQHSVPSELNTSSASMRDQWRAAVDHPEQIVCVGPKYQYAYVDDHVHLTADSYDRIGEKTGQAFFQHVVMGEPWLPLQPASVEREGAVLSVRFDVPVPPLVWDVTLPFPHQTALTEWRNGRGFEVYAGNARVEIESVSIVGDDTVQITCSTDPGAGNVVVRYAWTADGVPMPGGTARWGNLRDSDPFQGELTGSVQANYAVSFELPVP